MAEDVRPFNPQTAYDAVTALVLALASDAENIRVVYDTATGRGVIPIPAHDAETVADEPSPLTEMQAAVAEVIKEAKHGETLSFEGIALKSGYANSEGLRGFVRTLSATGQLEKTPKGWKKCP